jgi:hypothetical protein
MSQAQGIFSSLASELVDTLVDTDDYFQVSQGIQGGLLVEVRCGVSALVSLLAQVGLYEVAKRFRVQEIASEQDNAVGEKGDSVVVKLEQA